MKTQTASDYIIDESPDVSLNSSVGWVNRFQNAFPAFRHRNYQLYFYGQLTSLIGTWLQTVAQGWLVLQLTQSAFLVGVVAFLNTLPILIFALFGGVIVDRFDKKKIILFTQIGQLLLAFILGLLTVLGIVNFVEIAIISFLVGIITAVDMPARQAFVIEMVGKKDLHSAIALNAGTFNGARVLGPAVAGILIALVGTGGAFLLNAASFSAVVMALLFINVQQSLPQSHPNPLQAIKEGLNYAFTHPEIRTLLLSVAIMSIFGWSYATIMPVIAEDVFRKGATELGFLYASSGLGALFGVVLLSALAKKFQTKNLILGGSFLFSIPLFIFTFTTNFYFALFLLFLEGMGLIIQFSTTNTTIQHLVPDHLRGRVMSIYTLMFLGMSPFGSLQVGFFAEHLGPLNALRVGSIVLLLFALLLYFKWTQEKPNF